ncbi:MAG: CAP domain-containing protein [Chloroflexota bacterium]
MQPNFQVIFSANAKAGDTIEVSNSAGLSQVLLMDDATHTKFKNFERVSFPGPDNTTRTTATYTIRYDGRWHVLSDGGEGKVTHTKVQIDLPPKHKLSFGDISNREAQAFIADVLRLTNAERTKARLNPLHANDMLHHAAQGHTMNMALQGFQSHTGLDGSIPAVRISVTGYRASLSAENIAFGWQSAEDVVKGWMGSPGHRKNILMRDVTEIGIGIYYRADDPGAENYRYYWTQVFAKPT